VRSASLIDHCQIEVHARSGVLADRLGDGDLVLSGARFARRPRHRSSALGFATTHGLSVVCPDVPDRIDSGDTVIKLTTSQTISGTLAVLIPYSSQTKQPIR
jgi:hypothetical protein